jgi:hypothetical protein
MVSICLSMVRTYPLSWSSKNLPMVRLILNLWL